LLLLLIPPPTLPRSFSCHLRAMRGRCWCPQRRKSSPRSRECPRGCWEPRWRGSGGSTTSRRVFSLFCACRPPLRLASRLLLLLLLFVLSSLVVRCCWVRGGGW